MNLRESDNRRRSKVTWIQIFVHCITFLILILQSKLAISRQGDRYRRAIEFSINLCEGLGFLSQNPSQ